jgi:hypothetical protein
MAFDRPILADQVEHLSLFSAFSRAPIIGSLMYLLGGVDAKEAEEEQRQRHDMSVDDSSITLALQAKTVKPALKQSMPSLIGSDISASDHADMMDCHPLKQAKKNLSWSDESGQSLVEFIGQVRSTQHMIVTRSSALFV